MHGHHLRARSLNELYRARLLQLVVTFHGGMQAIAYNWGSFNYYRTKPHRSPDDASQRTIAAQMSRFAGTGGAHTHNRQYPISTMNDLVYPVHGGLEDWGTARRGTRPSLRHAHPSRTAATPLALRRTRTRRHARSPSSSKHPMQSRRLRAPMARRLGSMASAAARRRPRPA